jgi:hypothetical protein
MKQEYSYLDKRDENGVLLRYSGDELAYEVANNALRIIKNTRTYDSLVESFPHKYIDLYYEKMFYLDFLPIAHQLVIYQHDKRHLGEDYLNNIDVSSFPSKILLQEIWPEPGISYSKPYNFQLKKKAKIIYKSVKENIILSRILNFTNQNSDKKNLQVNIAVNYQEGFDLNKRSDIFWYPKSGIKAESVIIYYENPQMMLVGNTEQTAQEFFRKCGFKQIKLWEWRAPINHKFNDKLIKFKSLKQTNEIEKWLNKNAYSLCKNILYWTSFFEAHGIKIHHEPVESGINIIIKQIALHNLGGCSVGKLRSYPPTNIKGGFLGYYPNDIFFTWGNESAKGIQTSNSHIENIIVTGFPYNSLHYKPKNNFQSANKINKKKFSILLLDTNNSPNKDLMQVVDSFAMTIFYKKFLDWTRDDQLIELTIKPKKPHWLENLNGILETIEDLERTTGRCHLVNDPKGKMGSTFLRDVDMVVSISVFLPSALFETTIHGARGVFWDYANIRIHEPNLYKWGENKVIFSDLDEMLSRLEIFKNNHEKYPALGDWSEHLDDIDPFRDNRGGERIGTYMRWLLEGFEQGMDREENILKANQLYADAWGKDKIFKSATENTTSITAEQ